MSTVSENDTEQEADLINYIATLDKVIGPIYDRWQEYGGTNRLGKYLYIPVTTIISDGVMDVHIGDKSYNTKEELYENVAAWNIGDFAAKQLHLALWSCRDKLATLFLINMDNEYSAYVLTYPLARSTKNTTVQQYKFIYEVGIDGFSAMN